MWSAFVFLCVAADVALAKKPLLPGLGLGTGYTPPKSSSPYKTIDVDPPIFHFTSKTKNVAPGFLFLQPMAGKQSGGFIMTNSGELVYAGHGGTNFGVQEVNGKVMLNYWSGTGSSLGFGYGGPTLLDDTYAVKYKVCPQLGLYIPFKPANMQPKCQSDLHESQATTRGTTMVSAYNVTTTDLSSVGGPKKGYVLDSQFHEVEVATSKVIFSWSSIQHVAVSKARVPLKLAGKSPTRPFDFFHINAVERLPDGRYFVSSRQTSAVYLIKAGGKIEWTFNGYDGADFALPKGEGSEFSFQHHARIKKINTKEAVIHFFDNNNAGPTLLKPSRGVEYHLDLINKKATLVKSLHVPLKILHSDAEGSFQSLPGGHSLVSYGVAPVIQEYGPGGDTDIRMDINFGDGVADQRSYRVFKYEWSATPFFPPSVAAESGTGYVSWNGATDVTGYKVFTGTSKGHLKAAGSVAKTGFETSFPLPAGTKFMKVAAYKGTTKLSESKVLKVTS